MSRFPLQLFLSGEKTLVKTKSPRVQVFWHVGFGISFCTEVLGPQQPQARNVMFATATAVAATTHGLASHSHYSKDYVGWFTVSMPSLPAKTPIQISKYLDAGTCLGVTSGGKSRPEVAPGNCAC
jgi:hypothetical protein